MRLSLFQVSMNLIFTLRSSCELETYIVAVERIQEYTDAPTEVGQTHKYRTTLHSSTIPYNSSCWSPPVSFIITFKADWILPDSRPPREWPIEGSVSFTKYSTRYREGLDLVLKGITCHIKPGEKVTLFYKLNIHNDIIPLNYPE